MKYIQCKACGKIIPFKGGKHSYCDDCAIIQAKEKQKARDWKRVVANRVRTAKDRLCKCPACGVEFSRLSQGSNKKYCGNFECEKERWRRKSLKSNRKIRNKKKQLKQSMIEVFNKEHGVGISFNDYDKPIMESRGRNKAYSLDYVKYCLDKCGYTLLSDSYVNITSPLKVICPNGHELTLSFGKFIKNNQRCTVCKSLMGITNVTKGELLVSKLLTDNNIKFIYRDKYVLADYNMELDFYIQEHKVAIEVCGLYWHSEVAGNKSRHYHRAKFEACCKKGIRLITIFYDELFNSLKVVRSRILNAVNCIPNRLYARNTHCCIIDKKQAKSFLDTNHLQKYSPCKFSVGMFNNDRLVGVMTWGDMSRSHTKVDDEDTIELKRFAFVSGVSVVGGASKLFKFSINYIKSNYPSYVFIKSFCDMRYANPFTAVYDILGFDLYDETRYTPHYITDHYSKRLRNQTLARTSIERLSGLSEWDIRRKQGYDRIWDCGHRSYVYCL